MNFPRRPSSSKRHIADVEILSKYNATPIYFDDIGNKNNRSSLVMIAEAASELEETITSCCTGISIFNWDIQTSSSTIANEKEMDTLTSTLEDIANDNEISRREGGGGVDCYDNNDGNDNGNCKAGKVNKKRIQRRLNIPEIVFLNAFLKLKLKRKQKQHDDGQGDVQQRNDNKEGLSLIDLTWNASDALVEWASCHSHFTSSAAKQDDQTLHDSHRGVSVIQSIDAKLWSERHKKQQLNYQSNTTTTFGRNSVCASNEFNYDWTFSTPYTGMTTINQDDQTRSNTNKNTNCNHLLRKEEAIQWIPSSTSN